MQRRTEWLSAPASYSEDSGSNLILETDFLDLNISILFLNSFRPMSDKCLKLGHCPLLTLLLNSVSTYHHIIGRYIFVAVESVVK
jgi:hypothetical protein